MDDYRTVNRANWDERAPVHAASPDYGFSHFIADPAHLSDVVRFDLPLLGDIRGQRGLHLQCHIGSDTISLARLGARMTGLDFSPASLRQARLLAEQTHTDLPFVEGEVYDAPGLLERGAFDLVYTGIGALCWMPDVRRWAAVVADLLRPGGRLFIREEHPILWALDDTRQDDLLVVDYPYFETVDPLVWEEATTYVETHARLTNATTHSWNHGLGEIVSALLDSSMRLTCLVEHQSVPWDPLPGKMERLDTMREWRLRDRPWRLPLSYTLQAIKRP